MLRFHDPLRSTGFHRLPRYYEVIRLLPGLRAGLLIIARPTAFADPERSLRVRVNDVPLRPSPIPHLTRLEIGLRVRRHAHPDRLALRGFTFVRCCGSRQASIPHALAGRSNNTRWQCSSRAAALSSWLPPVGPKRDLHPQSFTHASRTSHCLSRSWACCRVAHTGWGHVPRVPWHKQLLQSWAVGRPRHPGVAAPGGNPRLW
jgi:hypothetical protein